MSEIDAIEKLTINPEVTRKIEAIAEVVVRKVLDADPDASLPPFLSIREVVRLTRRKTLVNTDVRNGRLKLSIVGGQEVIRKKDYIKWRDGI